MNDKVFIDGNVLLYLLSADAAKADAAERVMDADSVISVQVLNEVTNVARRKLGMSWAAIAEFLSLVRAVCQVEALTVDTYDRAVALAQRYTISVYDSVIVAAALNAHCKTLFSEDLQHGMVFEETLTVRNPFQAR
jgi:predicted nucleic acid-binding protein